MKNYTDKVSNGLQLSVGAMRTRNALAAAAVLHAFTNAIVFACLVVSLLGIIA